MLVVDRSEGYAARKNGSAPKLEAWLAPEAGGRLRRFLGCVEASRREAAAQALGSAKDAVDDLWPFLLGDAPCYVDFLLLNALLVHDYCFGPEAWAAAAAAASATGTSKACAALAARPSVAAYLATAEAVLYRGVKGMPHDATSPRSPKSP